MMYAKSIIYVRKKNFDTWAEEFLQKHPVIGFTAIAVGMPLCSLAALLTSTIVIMLPISFFMGWL